MRLPSVPAILTALLLPAATAFAQASGAPPQPATKGTVMWPGYILMFLLLAVVVSVSLFPSKRSHTD